MLVLAIPEDFNELFKDRRLTAITPLGKLGGVMVVTVHAALVLVVTIRCTKYGGTHGTREMLDVVFPVERCDVGASQSLPALEAE